MKKYWKGKKLEELRQLAPDHGAVEIARLVSSTPHAVRKACSLNGIPIYRADNIPGGENYVPPNKGNRSDAVQADPFGSVGAN